MADKIARFKQALRSKANNKQKTKSDGALGDEIQKYKLSEKKGESPKQGEHDETEQVANKQVPDKHSKTSAQSNTSAAKKQEPHTKRDSGEGRKENTNNSTLRLSTHARSSKLIQRKGQSNKDQTSSNKPAPKDPLKSKSIEEKDHVQTPTSPVQPSNGEKPLNFFKNITTSIHKHILAGEPQPSNNTVLNLKSNLEANSQSMSRIVDDARVGANETEASVRLSEHILQLTDVVGELFQSETSAWKSSMPSSAPSFFDTSSSNIPTTRVTSPNLLHTSLGLDSYSPMFIDQPFGSRKRSYEWERDDDDLPRHKTLKVHSSAPENTRNLFDDGQPVDDFFGFSHSQEDSFSDFSRKKLFSSNFLDV